MSAIFGIFNMDGKPVQPKVLDEMAAVLSHRGPDGRGVWHEEAVGLGHLMLSTTPESAHEKLPKRFPESQLTITADARIDNRDELISTLCVSRSSSDVPITDADLILLAYEKWGNECTQYLLGDFAFAIWDSRRQSLFCARDHFGAKPFFYHASEKLFVFATEIKALLLLPQVPRRLNEVRLVNHLKSDCEDKESTFYRDILRLQPAHAMTIDRSGKRGFQYWNLELGDQLKLRSDEEYAVALREQFTDAVARRLRGTGPIGTMLSGGLDSSSITCLARKLLRENGGTRPLHTFSAVFDDVKECDEREYMNTVIRENSVTPHFSTADKYGPFFDIDEMLRYLDEPLYAGNLYLNWLSYKKAKANDVKVILDGFDGDNTISHGVGFFTELAHQRRWSKLAWEISTFANKTNVPVPKVLWSWLWYLKLDALISGNRLTKRARNGVRRLKRRVGIGEGQDPNRSRLGIVELNPAFQKRLEDVAPVKKGGKRISLKTERELHLQALILPGNPFTLEMLERAAASFSVEMRFPFWDKKLIEFCLSVPAEQKIRNGWTRRIMRNAMAGILPPEIQWRQGKTNMAASFSYGFLKFSRELMHSIIVDNPEPIADFIDVRSLREAHRRFLGSSATDTDIMAIQRTVSLALWLQKQGEVH